MPSPSEVPAPFRQTAPSQIELREGGGCLSLFGLPFFLAGVFITLAGLGVLPVSNASGMQWWGRPLMVLMGLVFLAVGGGLVFGRRWTIVDAGQGSVIRSWGLLIPMRHEERRLTEFNAVVLAFESGDSDSSDRYPVRLRTAVGKDLKVCSATQFEQSRAQAEYLSRFLRLPLADKTTDSELVLSPERVSQTLQERLRSGGAEPGREVRPMELRSEVSESCGHARIEIPGRKSVLPALAFSIVPAAMMLFVVPTLLRFFRQTHTPDFVGYAFLAFLIFGFGFLPLMGAVTAVVLAIRSRTVVTAAPEGIQIERQGAWRAQTTSIAAGDILALDCSTAGTALNHPMLRSRESSMVAMAKKWIPSKGVVVKSRAGLFLFGEGLPAEELRYLQSVVVRALAGC